MNSKSPRPAWVYIVECADGTLYTGWCYDVAARVATHNAGPTDVAGHLKRIEEYLAAVT